MTDERDAPGTLPDTGGHRYTSQLSDSSRNRVRSDGGGHPGRDHHRIVRELRGELARHPAVRSVEGEPPDTYRELRATIDPSWFGRGAETASLRVTWIPDPSPGPEASHHANDTWERTPIRAYYTLHYQERDGTNDTYTYEPVSFGARSVSGLLWETMDALADRVGGAD